MLKHGRHYPRKKAWSMRYLRWLQEQQFAHPAHQIVLQEMVEAVRLAKVSMLNELSSKVPK
jgi:transposase